MVLDAVEHSAERRALTQGVLVMTTFGLAWALLGILSLDLLPLPRAAAVVVGVAAAVVCLLTARRSIQRLSGRAVRRRQGAPRAGRVYWMVNLAQTVVVVVAVFALVRVGQAGLIPALTCAVVGTHFLPLAKVYDLPLYLWTGLLLIVIAVVGAVVLLLLEMQTGPAWSVVGLPAALVLWATSLAVARRG